MTEVCLAGHTRTRQHAAMCLDLVDAAVRRVWRVGRARADSVASRVHTGASTQEPKGAARAQVAVEAETLSSAPGLRRRVLGELLQHLLDGFADAVPGHLEGAAAAARPAAWLANLQG